MHISEGVLSAPVLVTGVALAVAGTSVGLKKMDYEKIPQVAVLSSAFFVASLIHVPVGPSSVHLILNGVNGLLLGWSCFPSILVALALQAILFQFGGITVLGVNTITMALPGVICYYLFGKLINQKRGFISLVAAFACGFVAVLISGILVAISLLFTEESFMSVAKLIVLAHLPVMIIEGTITLFCVAFLKRVKPELLGGIYGNWKEKPIRSGFNL
ncbi:MAG: cobalt transporter CbiM [Deltaproteobacteria bacterium]|nr:cobalt transporter CbiM [Deltaproteobacteria bacterium]MBW1793880.1 cobalt transporter CbiM [Deltaproteobacteria bacterium]MBW2330643.1 cobalt transporter CbiM [Deltaproteobacteria bacterium]